MQDIARVCCQSLSPDEVFGVLKYPRVIGFVELLEL